MKNNVKARKVETKKFSKMVQANPIGPGIEDSILSEKWHHRQSDVNIE